VDHSQDSTEPAKSTVLLPTVSSLECLVSSPPTFAEDEVFFIFSIDAEGSRTRGNLRLGGTLESEIGIRALQSCHKNLESRPFLSTIFPQNFEMTALPAIDMQENDTTRPGTPRRTTSRALRSIAPLHTCRKARRVRTIECLFGLFVFKTGAHSVSGQLPCWDNKRETRRRERKSRAFSDSPSQARGIARNVGRSLLFRSRVVASTVNKHGVSQAMAILIFGPRAPS